MGSGHGPWVCGSGARTAADAVVTAIAVAVARLSAGAAAFGTRTADAGATATTTAETPPDTCGWEVLTTHITPPFGEARVKTGAEACKRSSVAACSSVQETSAEVEETAGNMDPPTGTLSSAGCWAEGMGAVEHDPLVLNFGERSLKVGSWLAAAAAMITALNSEYVAVQ